MKKGSETLPKIIIAALAVIGILCIVLIVSRAGKNTTAPQDGTPTAQTPADSGTTSNTSGTAGDTSGTTGGTGKQDAGTHTVREATDNEPLRLTEFCNDPALDAWFDSLSVEVPVKMTAIMLGEGPVYMEFTDPDLILATLEGIYSVQIGGRSSEDPDLVADAGGWDYYFEMADRTRVSFSFVLGTFRWKGSPYHKVVRSEALSHVNEELLRIGNPQYQYIYAPDNGFYTQYLETYAVDWQEEDGCAGGITIYTGEEGNIPYVSICRCAKEETDAEVFLDSTLVSYVYKRMMESSGEVVSVGEIERYTAGREEYPSIQYTVKDKDGRTIEIQNVVRTEEDDLTHENCLIRFSAAYEAEDTAGKSAALRALETAVREFYFHYKSYEREGVQPGELLVDFCNDARLTAWFDQVEQYFPDELVYTSDRWHIISKRENVRAVIEALKTVRIGGVSSKHVGASGRQIFDFVDHDTGDSVSFMFFQDTFDWDGESYDVLDWGDLAKLDLMRMAEE